MKRLFKIWKERRKILEGIRYTWFPNKYVEVIAEKRLKICEKNSCGYYDPKGESPKAYVKGKPACGNCGCNLQYLTHSLHSSCSLKEIGRYPMWDVEMTEEEEKKFREKTGLKNE